jgi:beta-galactosidase
MWGMQKYILRSLLAVVVVLPCVVHAQNREAFFPMSVWYSGGKARAPMLEQITAQSEAEWRKDLQQIRDLGFNTVRTWVEWTACEPRSGEYHFENLRLMARLARENNLKLLIQAYVDSAPDWVGRKFPDSHFVAQNGAAIPSQASPGFCFDHAGVRQAVLDFYRAVAREVKNDPNFIAWDLWSEPHIINWAIIDYIPNASFCYCPHSQKRFREWLQGKYGTLDQLNRAWYRTFEDWQQVEPPRFGTILSYRDYIDWKSYIAVKLAEDLGMRARAVREVDSRPVVTSHAAVPSLFTTPAGGDGIPDDRMMAAQLDYYGTSIYPKHSTPSTHWSLMTRTVAVDFTRSMNLKNGGFYIGELQGGYGVRGTIVGDPITPGDHRTWIWSILAKGARAINIYAYYPMNSGYESGGYGLINLDGTPTARSRTAGEIARTVTRNAPLFLESRPVAAQVAILYNPIAHMVGGEQSGAMRGAMRYSLTGVYRAFFEKSIPVDFLHAMDLESEGAARYKALYVPYPLMLSGATARQLRKYVEEGGTLIAEARFGWNNERGYAEPVIPGFGMQEVFGVREKEIRYREKSQMKIDPGARNLLGIAEGKALVGAGFEQSYDLLSSSARILARWSDGSPAAVASLFGKGKAVSLGTFMGYAFEQNPERDTGEFLRSLARWAGVVPVVETELIPAMAPVESRVLEGSQMQLWITVNHSMEAVNGRMGLRLPAAVYAVKNLETGAAHPATYSNGMLRVELALPPQGVLVLLVSP